MATSVEKTAANMRTLASGMSEYTENMFAPTVSKGLSKNVHTDEASFNQFLDQVIKAHLQNGPGGEEALRAGPRKMRRNLTGLLEGVSSGGCFRTCPKTQACCFKVCARVESSAIFGLLCWAFLLLHCTALVQVANKQGNPSLWYAVSQSYMVFFVFELLIRIAAAPQRFFWESGFVVLDIVLLLLSVAEALRPSFSDEFGQGQFTLLILHVLRFLRGLQSLGMPEAASAVTACFGGVLPVAYFVLLCCVWSFLAVVWYLVFSSAPVAPTPYADFGSSVLSQFYLACNALNWDRVTEPLAEAGTQTASVLAALFVVALLSATFMTINGTIIFFHELADKGIADYRRYDESKQMRRRLLGLSRLETSLQEASRSLGAAADGWAEWLMQDRQRVADVMEKLQPNLKMLKVSVTEVLQLYDHLFEVSRDSSQLFPYMNVPFFECHRITARYNTLGLRK